MNKLITYNFNGGPLDQLLGQLIGGSREAQEERSVRAEAPVIIGRSIGYPGYIRREDGFFYQQGKEQFRTFLYLKQSKVKSYGLPKRHYFPCEKVREGLPYVFANQDRISVRCSESGDHHGEVQLDVCGYCRSLFQEKTSQILLGTSFEEFILSMEESELTKTRTTGLNGYIINWPEIGTAFKKTKNYTCERCSLKITKHEHQDWIHAHHRNRDKRDNRRANLECLCIRCHSQVDDLHRRNFAEPHQQRSIKEFNIRYPR